MPYITQQRREELLNVPDDYPETPGELNFILTMLCIEYMKRSHKNYQAINDIIGALECCKQEFYRRVVVPYEDGKIETNGDVFNV